MSQRACRIRAIVAVIRYSRIDRDRGIVTIRWSELPGRRTCIPLRSSAKSRRWSIERGFSESTDLRPAGKRPTRTAAPLAPPSLPTQAKTLPEIVARPGRRGTVRASFLHVEADQRKTSSRSLGGNILASSSSRYSPICPFSAKPIAFESDREASSRGA